MGHRVFVAVETSDGRYTLYHLQWGGQALLEGRDPSEVVTAALASGHPVETGVTAAAALDTLDPRTHEALLVRDSRGVRAFLVVWLGFDLASGGVAAADAAALVPWTPEVGPLRAFARDAKGRLGDAVDAGALTEATAVALFRAGLEARPAVGEGVIWLPLDARE